MWKWHPSDYVLLFGLYPLAAWKKMQHWGDFPLILTDQTEDLTDFQWKDPPHWMRMCNFALNTSGSLLAPRNNIKKIEMIMMTELDHIQGHAWMVGYEILKIWCNHTPFTCIRSVFLMKFKICLYEYWLIHLAC